MQSLKVAYLQIDLHWQQPDKNREMIEAKLAEVPDDTELLVLPEMFLTGFSMAPETSADPWDGTTANWLLALAKQYGMAICGSIAVDLQDDYRNRFLFVTPEGTMTRYDKRHLFTMGDEDKHYQPGENRVLIHYRGWRILPIICYDLRFPVWCRNHDEYDLMICVANWPASRRNAWRTLLQARAIENQCYVVGVNRVGVDGQGLKYSGDSLLVDFKGDLLQDSAPGEVYIGCGELNLPELRAFKDKFPAYRDADSFSLSGVKTSLFEL